MQPKAHYVCEEIPQHGAPWRHPATTFDAARLSASAAVRAARFERGPLRPRIVRVVDILTGRAVSAMYA